MIKKHYPVILLFLTAGLIISLGSCDPARKYEKMEREVIDFYLSSNSSLNFVKEPSGLYYLDVLTGTGRTPVAHDTVYITYTGYLTSGTQIGSNLGKTPLKTPIGEDYLIPGLEEGILYMKEGGQAKFLIPSSLAYGTKGSGDVSGYTPLIYDIILDSIKLGQGKK
jgi:FKBP-type peptidyl-prolyl cis-trans isomerase FkpA